MIFKLKNSSFGKKCSLERRDVMLHHVVKREEYFHRHTHFLQSEKWSLFILHFQILCIFTSMLRIDFLPIVPVLSGIKNNHKDEDNVDLHLSAQSLRRKYVSSKSII